MKTVEIVTLKAAYDVTKGSNKYVNLRELQTMCLPQKKAMHGFAKQGWTYIGDWRKVKPYFHAA